MSPDNVWEFRGTDLIKFGVGAVEELGYEAGRFHAEKALIITDPGVREAGICDRVQAPLEESGIETVIWDQAEPEPTTESYDRCYKDNSGLDVDVVVSVGGGSSLDIGKSISMMLEHGGEVRDYIRPPVGKGQQVPGPGLPNIAIPTTSGTASEVTQVSVLSEPDGDAKVAIASPYLRPEVALVDPELTVTLPPNLTASTGLDALAHAVEAYTHKSYCQMTKPETPADRPSYAATQLTDCLAIKAIELIGDNLRMAVNNGDDIQARKGMSLASLISGLSFGNAGVHLVHALGHTVGAMKHKPHGISCAVLMPPILRKLAEVDFEHLSNIARVMGEDLQGLNPRESAMKGAEAVEQLMKDVDCPLSMKELGVTENEIPAIAKATMENNEFLATSSRRHITEDDLEDILREAL